MKLMILKLGYSLNNHRNLLNNFSIPFVLKLTGTVCAFLLYQFISTHYGADGVGIYSLFNVIISLLAILCTLGMASSTIQFIPKFLAQSEYENLKRLGLFHIFISGTLSTLVSIFLFLNSEFLSVLFFQSNSNEKLISMIAVFLPFYTMFLIGIVFLRGLSFINLFEYFRSMHVQTFGLIILILITTYCSSGCYINNWFGFIEPNYIAILISGILYGLASIFSWSVVYYFLFSRMHDKHRILANSLTLKKTLSVSFPMLATALSAIIMDRIDTLMLAYFYGNTEVGLYNIAIKLSSLVLFLIIPLISSVITKISNAYWEKDTVKFNYLIDVTSKIMFWSSAITFLVVVMFSEFLLGLFGIEFVQAKVAMFFLSTGFFFNAMHGLVEHMMDLSGNERKLSWIFMFGLIINIILNYYLIPIYGIEGAAFATMVGMVFWNITAGIFCCKHIGRRVIYLPFTKS